MADGVLEAVRAALEGELRLMDMVAELAEHPGSAEGGPVYEPSDIVGVLLAPGLVHLTYETCFEGRRARRSSLWRRRDEETGWRMYYHQGTPVPPEVPWSVRARPGRARGSPRP